MGSTIRAAFWTSSIGLGLLLAALALPLWLGHYGKLTDKEYIGLFYRIVCVSVVCDVVDQMLDSESVQLQGQEKWAFEIVVIPVLVTISAIFCVIACCILEAIQCGLKHGDNIIRRILAACAFLLLVSAIFGTTGLFLSYYMADKYYETNTITHAAEFPWAILLLTLAMIMIFIACIMYLVIVCKWYNYCHHFGCRRPWYMDEPDGGKAGIYTINRNSRRLRSSARRESPPSSSYGTAIPSFTFNGVNKKDSTYYDHMRSSSYSDFRATKSGKTYYDPMRSSSYSDFRTTKSGKKYSSYSDLRHSPRTSLHDSPKILRASRMPEFIKDEQNFLRQSRKSGYGSGIDPAGITVRSPLDKPIIRQSHSDMDIPRDTRNEPSVLDILYRESRKSKY